MTDFGKSVKHRLVDIDKSPAWLTEKVHELTGLSVDSSYLSKILRGKRNPPRVIEAIREILDLQETT